MPIQPAFSSGGSAPAADPLEVIKEYNFTTAAATDLSAAGTVNVLDTNGAALCTIITTHDASGGTIDGNKDVDINSNGIVVDVTSDSGGENVVLAVALPTDIKANLDADLIMFEWLISGVAMTGTNNSLVKSKVSTSADMRGTPSNGLVAIRSSGPTSIDIKGERQYSSGVTRSAAIQNYSGGNLHVQLIMRETGGIVYYDTGTSFSAPHSPTNSIGLGARSFPAAVPLGKAGVAPVWTAPYMVLMADCNTTGDRCQFTVSKFRICKFSPSVN